MVEIELQKPVQLEGVQTRLLDLHSALNVLTVISNELNILQILAGAPPELARSKQHIQTLKQFLLEDQAAHDSQAEISFALEEISSDTSALLAKQPDLSQEINLPLFQRNLKSLFEILKIRHQELTRRNKLPLQWGEIAVSTLKENLIHVFEAMELNSHGRYHIVYSPEQKGPGDYLLQIEIDSRDPEKIQIPLVLQDIMRDLCANARKYSEPGGKILTKLQETPQELTLAIEDQGMGIPAEELEKIVEFGQRGSNAMEKRTMGGGFGLTKAWYFTHLLGGRMWIASELNRGTRIQLKIPRNPHSEEN
jgi:signal transduction histidine kinase